MRVSLVIPFIVENELQQTIIDRCVEVAKAGIVRDDTEIVLIDNTKDNKGVLSSFPQGLELAKGDIIAFIHSDVLLWDEGWDERIAEAFKNKQIGLIGLFGAVGVGNNGGRVRSQSNMLGKEWGKCEGVEFAWQHHSEHVTGLVPATILDGVGMFFSREALQSLTETDMFDSWRAIHHFYDRIIPLKLIDKGYKVATLGIGFDHWSGITANASKVYEATGKKWLIENNSYREDVNIDKQIYDIAERQFMDEFQRRLPCTVDSNWDYIWQGIR